MNHVFLRAVATVCLLASNIACGTEGIRIVATDEKLEAPDTIRAGTRHIIFENRGKQIHEAMFVKLQAGMTVGGFREQINKGILFPEGALDYSGAGLMSPGETTEVWLPLDPGEYVLICWNHMRSSIRGLTVAEGKRVNDTPPREDAVLQLRDFQFELQGHLKKGMRVIFYEPDELEAEGILEFDAKTERWIAVPDFSTIRYIGRSAAYEKKG